MTSPFSFPFTYKLTMNPRIISAVPKNTIFMLKISPLPWGMKPHIRGNRSPRRGGFFGMCHIPDM